ncbi:membrane protein insertion efficiency factor YidD [Lusitaniella coriacea LEGE 07157]|uniref:Membrane protein insertion efficiency factor YidD n=1 Tax=Lusitaniella coriacea LEGE 07157 TaxID=945747 RepID=A0A8J7JDU5_9CYAN|nr:membrane protein insertion efficiency factor YidD [Lusitaniella coriacea]MBE9118480.1 membrane protein insertion efficiency factor YidD [Lusitaniella coriacea LEGE 07157]
MISILRKKNIIDRVAIAAISGYQRYLSPHKGFSCAHRIVYGGDSCSQYVKRAIARQGLIAAIPLSQQRFADCKASHEVFKEKQKTSHRRRRHLCSSSDCATPCCEAIPEFLDFEGCLSDFPDIDCTPDCGDLSCDLGSLVDCGCCDVSSCS